MATHMGNDPRHQRPFSRRVPRLRTRLPPQLRLRPPRASRARSAPSTAGSSDEAQRPRRPRKRLLPLSRDPTHPVEIPRSRLISELGWQGRLDLRNDHKFPEPTIPYREIAPTVRGLEQALERLTGGY